MKSKRWSFITSRCEWKSCSNDQLIIPYFCKFQIYLQRLHSLELPDQNLKNSLNLLSDVSRFIPVGNALHIFGPKIFKLLSLYVALLWLLLSKSYGPTRAFCLLVKKFFIKLGFKLLKVLDISVTNCFVLLLCMVEVPLIFKSVS